MTTLTSIFFTSNNILLSHHQATYVFKKKYVLLFASPIIQQPFVSSVYAILGFILLLRLDFKTRGYIHQRSTTKKMFRLTHRESGGEKKKTWLRNQNERKIMTIIFFWTKSWTYSTSFDFQPF